MNGLFISKLLRAIEQAYQMEDGELDAFVNEVGEIPTTLSKFEMITKLQSGPTLGCLGLVKTLKDIANAIPDPIESDVMLSFIDATTERLSEEDIDSLTDIVVETLVDFDIIEESPHDQDLKGYIFDEDGMHNGYVMLSLKDMDSLAKFLTQNDKRKMVTDLLDLPVVWTLDYPMGNILDLFGDGYKNLRAELLPFVYKYQQSNLEEPEEFPYLVSVLDENNNPSDNLDNFALKEDAIDYAKNNPGTGVFLEKYIEDKNICEYLLVWHPTAEVVDGMYDHTQFMEDMDSVNPKNVVSEINYHLDCIDEDGFSNLKIKEEIKRLLKTIDKEK